MQPKAVRAKWEPHVGKLVLSFTAIEHLVTISIDLLSEKAVSRTARTLLFAKRTELLLELVEKSKRISDNNRSKFSIQLKNALSLASQSRNLVAHNHVLMELYLDKQDGKIREREFIISPKNSRRKISLSELRRVAVDAERLAEGASATYLDIVGEYFQK